MRMLSFIDEQKTREMITIKLSPHGLMMAGRQYKISIGFVSILNEDLAGFYRSSYEQNGVTKYFSRNFILIFFDSEYILLLPGI